MYCCLPGNSSLLLIPPIEIFLCKIFRCFMCIFHQNYYRTRCLVCYSRRCCRCCCRRRRWLLLLLSCSLNFFFQFFSIYLYFFLNRIGFNFFSVIIIIIISIFVIFLCCGDLPSNFFLFRSAYSKQNKRKFALYMFI